MLSLIPQLLIGFSLTISPMGLTYHGLSPNPNAVKIMKNKITEDGKFALNPEVNLTMKTEHWQFGGGYLQDCFDEPAGMVYIGPKQTFLRYFSLGGIVGGYAKKVSGNTKQLPMSRVIHGAEVSPLAAATFSIEVPVTSHLSIESNNALNVFINHFMIGVKWNF